MTAPDTVHYGASVVGLGDVDRDGIGDFAVGAPGAFTDLFCVPGAVYVHSGVDGHLLYVLEGEGVQSEFGEGLVAPGDLTGDGIGDLVVAARRCCTTDCESGGPGRVSFFDGSSGTLLAHVEPDSLGVFVERGLLGFGSQVLDIGDLDGNGFGDVLTRISSRYGPNSRLIASLVALDGGTRTPILRMWNPYASVCNVFAAQLAPAGDVDADDFPDFFVSTPCAALGQPDDRVDLISGAPIGVRSLGGRCSEPISGRTLRIGATGVPEIGRAYPIHLSGLEPGERVRLLLGDLAPARARSSSGQGCAPRVRALEVRSLVAKPVRPGEGVATALVAIPNDTALIGLEFHAQWVIGAAPRREASHVLAIELQPGDPRRGW